MLLAVLCFTPQTSDGGVLNFKLDGMVKLGQMYFIFIPFNSLINAFSAPTLRDFVLAIIQNLLNIGLLYPLVLACLFLFEKWYALKTVLWSGFLISLLIETTQLLLDVTINAGRVFEVDDLITNTLGAYLAYLTYDRLSETYLAKKIQRADKP